MRGASGASGQVAGLASPCGVQQTEQNESATRRITALRLGLLSVPEIRCPIAKLLFRPPLKSTFVLRGSLGDHATSSLRLKLITVGIKHNCNTRLD